MTSLKKICQNNCIVLSTSASFPSFFIIFLSISNHFHHISKNFHQYTIIHFHSFNAFPCNFIHLYPFPPHFYTFQPLFQTFPPNWHLFSSTSIQFPWDYLTHPFLYEISITDCSLVYNKQKPHNEIHVMYLCES